MGTWMPYIALLVSLRLIGPKRLSNNEMFCRHTCTQRTASVRTWTTWKIIPMTLFNFRKPFSFYVNDMMPTIVCMSHAREQINVDWHGVCSFPNIVVKRHQHAPGSFKNHRAVGCCGSASLVASSVLIACLERHPSLLERSCFVECRWHSSSPCQWPLC